MKIMGIDSSLRSTGIVVLDEKGRILKTKLAGYGLKEKSEKEKIKRMLIIANEIITIGKDMDVSCVALEGVAPSPKNGRFGNQIQLTELFGIIKTQIFLSLKKVPIIVPPSTWKAKIIGSGRAKKEDVALFYNRINVFFESQDLYDALAIADYARRFKTLAGEE